MQALFFEGRHDNESLTLRSRWRRLNCGSDWPLSQLLASVFKPSAYAKVVVHLRHHLPAPCPSMPRAHVLPQSPNRVTRQLLYAPKQGNPYAILTGHRKEPNLLQRSGGGSASGTGAGGQFYSVLSLPPRRQTARNVDELQS